MTGTFVTHAVPQKQLARGFSVSLLCVFHRELAVTAIKAEWRVLRRDATYHHASPDILAAEGEGVATDRIAVAVTSAGRDGCVCAICHHLVQNVDAG